MFTTGIPALDYVLGGGFEAGIAEVYGDETDLQMHLALGVLERGVLGGVWYQAKPLQAAGARIPTNLQLGNALTLDDALQYTCDVLKQGGEGCVFVVDTMLESREELASPIGEADHFTKWQALCGLLQEVRAWSKERGALVLLLSEARDAFGGRNRVKSSTESLAREYTGARVRCTTKQETSEYGTTAWRRVQCRVVRSLCVPPGGTCDVMLFTAGINYRLEQLKWLVMTKVVTRAGNYFRFADGRSLGPGWTKAAAQLP